MRLDRRAVLSGLVATALLSFNPLRSKVELESLGTSAYESITLWGYCDDGLKEIGPGRDYETIAEWEEATRG